MSTTDTTWRADAYMPTSAPKKAYSSVEELLAPETLSAIEGRSVSDVRVEDRAPGNSFSNDRFLSVRTSAGSKYVVKLINGGMDRIMHITHDALCREVQLWRRGVLDSLPQELLSPTVACAIDRDGWALLMHDVGNYLVRPQSNLAAGAEHCFQFMDALAAMHSRYWEAPQLAAETGLFCSPRDYFRWSTHGYTSGPARARQHAPEILGQALYDTVEALIDDPQPLCNALDRYPRTLVHGDFSSRNLGVAGARTVIIDWHLAMFVPGTVDIGWHLISFDNQPIDKDQIIDSYRTSLSHRLRDRFNGARFEEELRLGLLGSFLMLGMVFLCDPLAEYGVGMKGDPAWWLGRVREGLQLL